MNTRNPETMTTIKLKRHGDVHGVFPKEFAIDVLKGLSSQVKYLPCKYIYDQNGSHLFEAIMELPEYYLTRSEMEIFVLHREAIARLLGTQPCNIIELGAGDGAKTRVLIGHLLEASFNFRYVPVDICGSAVESLTSSLVDEFPALDINGLASDYFPALRNLSSLSRDRNVVLFLGSSIGNFDPPTLGNFLNKLHGVLNDGDLVLIGFDLKKEVDLIARAYNDSAGITAKFNLNILRRINRELGGDFEITNFRYYGVWDALAGAVRSCLLSLTSQEIHVSALGTSFHFDPWEPIHTESSYKFSMLQISDLAEKYGFDTEGEFYDSRRYFVDVVWRVNKP